RSAPATSSAPLPRGSRRSSPPKPSSTPTSSRSTASARSSSARAASARARPPSSSTRAPPRVADDAATARRTSPPLLRGRSAPLPRGSRRSSPPKPSSAPTSSRSTASARSSAARAASARARPPASSTRGHRLVADDVVIVRRISPTVLRGRSAERLAHHLEIRGLGIIDVEALFGTLATLDERQLDLVVELVEWTDTADRLGLVEERHRLLEVELPL